MQIKLDKYANSCVTGGIFGERVPRYENHVRIIPDVKDKWGIPVLHIEARDGENERSMAQVSSPAVGKP